MAIPGRNTSTEGYDRIVTNCTVLADYTSLYEVREDTYYSRCDLVVINASKPHGGRYVCYNVDGDKSDEFLLSVLGNCPR